MKEKLKILQEEHRKLNTEYIEKYNDASYNAWDFRRDELLDRLKSIELTFRNLGMNVNYDINFDKL